MVKRLFVSGLSAYATKKDVETYFGKFGELYECQISEPPNYAIMDYGPDDEPIEERYGIRYEHSDESLNEEIDIERYCEDKHGTFEEFMKKIGSGEAYFKLPKRTCAGYAYITFVNQEGFQSCMDFKDPHKIGYAEVDIEIAKGDYSKMPKIDSKRLFVSFFPLERLTAKELKNSFGDFGKITDVEFVSDSDGSLHFCIVTFDSSMAVDLAIKKSFIVRGVRLFVRRAILREAIKMAEQKEKEHTTQAQIDKMHGYAGYSQASFYAQPRVKISAKDAISQGEFSYRRSDLSVTAGYGQGPQNIEPSSEGSSDTYGYGYGPRKW